MKGFLIALIIVMVAACSNKDVGAMGCDREISHTLMSSHDFDVFIYSPDSLTNPEIWEGPICIENRQIGSSCVFSESLVREVKFHDNESLSVTTFSGSNAFNWIVQMESCQSTRI